MCAFRKAFKEDQLQKQLKAQINKAKKRFKAQTPGNPRDESFSFSSRKALFQADAEGPTGVSRQLLRQLQRKDLAFRLKVGSVA